jgi:hypothetical protein
MRSAVTKELESWEMPALAGEIELKHHGTILEI